MSVLRRMMMDGFNIDAIPSSRKIYYTASEKITPSENSLGSEVSLNIYDAPTMNGVLVTTNDITTIGFRAFYDYSSLTSVNIPDSVTEIGSSAFLDCENLTRVTIPNSVTKIGYAAFAGCGLTHVAIPNSVTTIGDDAFYSCDSLTSVYCKATTPPTLGGTSVFDSNGSGRKIYVPTESVEAYKSATRWSEYSSAIVGYEF